MVIYRHSQKEDSSTMSGSCAFTNPHISNYNMLGERQYEIVGANDCTRDYNLLQHSCPPTPSGLNGNIKFASLNDLSIISTVSSQASSNMNRRLVNRNAVREGVGVHQGMSNPAINTLTSLKGNSVRGVVDHMYRELEQEAWRKGSRCPISPSNSNVAVNMPTTNFTYPEISCSLTQTSGAVKLEELNTIDNKNSNEELISPVRNSLHFGNGQCNVFSLGGLKGTPETGNVFSEPLHPTSFPVHIYEKITEDPDYDNHATHVIMPTHLSPIPSSLAGQCGSDSNVHYEMVFNPNSKDNVNHYKHLGSVSGDKESEENILTHGPQNTLLTSIYPSLDLSHLQQDQKMKKPMKTLYLHEIVTTSVVD